MGRAGSLGRAASKQTAPLKSFAEIIPYLDQAGEYLERLVYPSLRFGSCFWIPDEDSDFCPDGGSGEHPWIITIPYRPGTPTVTACPRTSNRQRARNARELFLPSGIVSGLDKGGVVLADFPRPFLAANFRHYSCIGLLPPEWQERLRAVIAIRARQIAKNSEEA